MGRHRRSNRTGNPAARINDMERKNEWATIAIKTRNFHTKTQGRLEERAAFRLIDEVDLLWYDAVTGPLSSNTHDEISNHIHDTMNPITPWNAST